MPSSIESSIKQFLDSIKMVDNTKYQILDNLREFIFNNYPDMNERMQYGGILFSLDEDVAGLFAYTNHISLEFSHGATFKDPDKLLEGKGKYRRHLKFRSLDDITSKQAIFYIQQIKN